MKRSVKWVLILLMSALLSMLITGCWSRKELNELGIVLAMGIDRVDQQYAVTVQLIDPSQMSRDRKADRSPTLIFSERASTIFEALRKITTKASRKMYFSHMRLLFFDENTAKKGIKEPLDFLFRDHEVRPDFYLAVAKDYKAKDILGLVTPTEVLPALDMYKSLKISEKAWSPTFAVNVTDLLQKFKKDGIEPVLTGLIVIGDIESGKTLENVKQPTSLAHYKYTGIGVFRDDRLIGWMNESDSKAFNYITNNVSNTVGKVKCPHSDGEFVVEVTRSKVKIHPMLNKAGEPLVKLEAFIEVNIGEVQCSVDLANESSLLELEQAASEQLEMILVDGIKNVQKKFGADVFGFGEAFHRKYPNNWHKWKGDWDHMFKNLTVEIKMDYHMRKIGKTISPIDNKKPKDEE